MAWADWTANLTGTALQTYTQSIMHELTPLFKALADPTRLRMLEFLRQPDHECCTADGSVCACDFEKALGLSQPSVSHHMKILVQAGLVQAHKQGRWMHYVLEPQCYEQLSDYLRSFAAANLVER